MRTFDISVIDEASEFMQKPEGFSIQDWVDDHANIALVNDAGDVALFEEVYPGVVDGHYSFVSRGRAAIDAAKEFIAEVAWYDVQVIRGLTPLTNLGARWLSRRLGFASHGVVHAKTGPHELFILRLIPE